MKIEPGTDDVSEFAVHLFPRIRVKVSKVFAGGPAEAMRKAEDEVDFAQVFDEEEISVRQKGGLVVTAIEFEEASGYARVDPILPDGEVDQDHSVFLASDGSPLVEGKTSEERKAAGFDLATRFWNELQDGFETLGDIANEHGVRTLADLMYLHQAILSGGHIDNWPDSSAVAQIVRALPSAAEWAKFIRDPEPVPSKADGLSI